MSDVRVLCIRIGDNFQKDKWEADALLAEEFEKIRTMIAAWRPGKLESGK
jgi:hypothetical protein